jgi:hypothetical protein
MRCLVPAVIALVLCAPAWAQESRAAIVGRVTDSTGAAVSGAIITATNLSTNVPVSAQANDQGDYQILFLIPGLYRVSSTAAGFKGFERGNLELRVSDRLNLDIALAVGDVKETLIVSAQTPVLETASTDVGQVADNQRIDELPLAHGDSRSLFLLMPGVSTAFGQTLMYADPSRPATISLFQFNGSPVGTTEFTMDGVPNMQTVNCNVGSCINNQPPADSIQELKMVTAYDASVGHTSGATVDYVLKSGTNALHGTGYYFYRNPALNANDFFANAAGQPLGGFDYKRPGFSLNGPVWIPHLYNGKNKTFFAYTYERMIQNTTVGSQISTVPTMAERSGDFSSLLSLGPSYQIYDPATTTPAANGLYSRLPFPGNIIPQSRFNPVAVNMLKYWPDPNAPGTPEGLNNFQLLNLPSPNNYQDHVFRLDHYINDKQRFFGRVTRYYSLAGPFYNFLNNEVSGGLFRTQPFNVVLDYVYTPSPKMVIDFRYGLNRDPAVFNLPSQGFNLASLGFSPNLISELAFRPPVAQVFPGVNISSIQSIPTFGLVEPDADNVHSFHVDVNRPVRSHSLKFGTDVRIYQHNEWVYGNATPLFNFGTTWTNGPLSDSAAAPSGIGQSMAAFLLGLPSTGQVDHNASYASQSSYYAGYVQDDWRASAKLTLTLGVRYEYQGPVTERYNRAVGGVDPTGTLPISQQVEANYAANPIPELPASQFLVQGGLLFAGAGGQPRGLWQPDRDNFAPRVGFAYNPLKNTVVRGGYGIYFVPTGAFAQDVPIQTGFSQSTFMTPSVNGGQTFVANLTNPFPNSILAVPGNSQGLMTDVGNSIISCVAAPSGQCASFYNPKMRTPYSQRWDFHVQQLLPGQFLLDVGYAGSRATKLWIPQALSGIPSADLSHLPYRDQTVINNLSALVPNPFYPLLPGTSLAPSVVSAGSLLCPYPQFACGVSMMTDTGFSWYHSLTARVERRLFSGFTYYFAYTWSKLMQAMTYLNWDDPQPDHTIAPFDRPQHFSLSAIYELPFGKGRTLPLESWPGPLRALASGWQAAAIWQLWSGQPLGFGNAIFSGNIHNISLPASQRSVYEWFNINAGFNTNTADQLLYNYQTEPMYYAGVRSDIMNTWDMSLVKYTNLFSEKVRFQFRVEALNALNHPSFDVPNTTVTSPLFGQVTDEINLPRIIQFGFKAVF